MSKKDIASSYSYGLKDIKGEKLFDTFNPSPANGG